MADPVAYGNTGERISRGLAAGRELPRTRAAIDKLKLSLIKALLDTPLNDRDGRERLYLSAKLLDPIEEMLIAEIADGDAANHTETMQRIMSGADRPVN